jgi:hypothetical protein
VNIKSSFILFFVVVFVFLANCATSSSNEIAPVPVTNFKPIGTTPVPADSVSGFQQGSATPVVPPTVTTPLKGATQSSKTSFGGTVVSVTQCSCSNPSLYHIKIIPQVSGGLTDLTYYLSAVKGARPKTGDFVLGLYTQPQGSGEGGCGINSPSAQTGYTLAAGSACLTKPAQGLATSFRVTSNSGIPPVEEPDLKPDPPAEQPAQPIPEQPPTTGTGETPPTGLPTTGTPNPTTGTGSAGGTTGDTKPATEPFKNQFGSGATDANTGGEVSKLQEKLGVKPTGTFDDQTKTALQDYQKKNDINPTGYFGENTQKQINTDIAQESAPKDIPSSAPGSVPPSGTTNSDSKTTGGATSGSDSKENSAIAEARAEARGVWPDGTTKTGVQEMFLADNSVKAAPNLEKSLFDVFSSSRLLQNGIAETRNILNEEMESFVLGAIVTTKLATSVDREREETLTYVSREILKKTVKETETAFSGYNPTVTGSFDSLKKKIVKSQEQLEKSLVNEGFVFADSTFKENVVKAVNNLEPYSDIYVGSLRLTNTDGVLVDTDGDSVSDFDEVNIYKTNPNKSHTAEGDLSDGEKILSGYNPLVRVDEKISFDLPSENPTEDQGLGLFQVTSIDLKKDVSPETGEKDEKITFIGYAPPNSLATLYIFSTPIVVTVKTNSVGEWEYVLDEELEDGQHSIYVASVNSSGKIVAQSRPFYFVKEADAVTLIPRDVALGAGDGGGFFNNNFVIIIGGLFLLGLIGALVVSGSAFLYKKVL